MIVAIIDEGGVREVRFRAKGGPFADASVLLWPTVRDELRRLDQAVKGANRRMVSRLLGKGA